MSIKLRMAAGAACCFVALFSGRAIAAGEALCWQPHEVEAARVQDLHTMLMLGVLKCRATNSEMDQKYTLFEEKKRNHISNYNAVLKAHFMREKGITDGQRAYGEFTTRLGNSHAAAPHVASFCQMTDTLLTLAVEASDAELPMLARNFSETPKGVGEQCGAAPATLAAVAEGDAVAAPPAAPEPAAAPAVPVKAAEAAPTPQSAAAALEAAAVALQSAAASMKAQTSAPVTTTTAAAPAEPEIKPAVVQVAPAG